MVAYRGLKYSDLTERTEIFGSMDIHKYAAHARMMVSPPPGGEVHPYVNNVVKQLLEVLRG